MLKAETSYRPVVVVSAQPTSSFCVDVMEVIVVATSVTRQDPQKASKARHIKIKGRNCTDMSSRALEANEHGCKRKINTRTPCVKNLCRNNKRTTGAEDTQNQHYQRVHTVVDILRFGSFSSVLDRLVEPKCGRKRSAREFELSSTVSEVPV